MMEEINERSRISEMEPFPISITPSPNTAVEEFPPFPAKRERSPVHRGQPVPSVDTPPLKTGSSNSNIGGLGASITPPNGNVNKSNGNYTQGGITPKVPSVKIKKQYSKIFRIKTKILQNLGKADKTTDELFNDYVNNFNKQQINATRLHKEISNYLRCARALHGASKALFETLDEVYEPEWVGHDLIYAQAQNSDMLWTDFCHKIQDQTLGPLSAYSQEFPEIRKKIDKRGRKLVDYDSQRHQLENLQRSNRRDEYKIARVKDQLENARSTYDSLNKELYDELPSIYDERIPNTAHALQTLFAAESTFMQETSKVSQELDAITDKLTRECAKGTYKAQRGSPPKTSRFSAHSPTSPRSPTVWYEASLEAVTPPNNQDLPPYAGVPAPPANQPQLSRSFNGSSKEGENESTSRSLRNSSNIGFTFDYDETHSRENVKKEHNCSSLSETASIPREGGRASDIPVDKDKVETKDISSNQDRETKTDATSPFAPDDDTKIGHDDSGPTSSTTIGFSPAVASPTDCSSDPSCPKPSPNSPNHRKRKQDANGQNYEEIEFDDKKINGGAPKINGDVTTQVPPGATTEGLPPGVLYKVKATYKYSREDTDELSFEVGEVIQVVEYEDPEEQEEGWLCGIKESDNEKGLFPANFTRPI